jgi:hypothetical protein
MDFSDRFEQQGCDERYLITKNMVDPSTWQLEAGICGGTPAAGEAAGVITGPNGGKGSARQDKERPNRPKVPKR